MNNYFEVKAKYQKTMQDGKEKMATEVYLLDAISFTEAEARINKELEPYIRGDFFIVGERISNVAELITDEQADKWFKAKIAFVTMDEEKGTEKKSISYILVQAENIKSAYENIEKAYSDSVTDYEIPSIAESPILDVFTEFESFPEEE